MLEQARGNLLAEVVDMFLRDRRVQWRAAHLLERLCPHPDGDILRPARARCFSIARRPTWVKGHQMSAKTPMTALVEVLELPSFASADDRRSW